MRIVVSGWVAGFPVAGFLWHPLGFALGLRDLGHDVWFLDDQGWSEGGFDPATGAHDPDCDAGERFLRAEMEAVGMGERWALRRPSGRVSGLPAAVLDDVLAEAELLVNVSLMLPDRPEYQKVPHRFAIDTDPVFTQVAAARGSGIPERHTRLFSFGRPPLPGQRPGEEWIPTRQAVHLAAWPVAPEPAPGAPFTTVTAWQAFAPLLWEGAEYGMKDRSIREHLDLPARTSVPLAVGLAGGVDRGEGRGSCASGAGPWRTRSHPRPAPRPTAATWPPAGARSASRSTGTWRPAAAGSATERPATSHRGGPRWCRTPAGATGCRPVRGSSPSPRRTTPPPPSTRWPPTPARHAAAARKVAEEHLDARRVCADLLEAGL